ncbi:MAG: hypothetical protein U1E65_07245 [Myxococcota bacterium]
MKWVWAALLMLTACGGGGDFGTCGNDAAKQSAGAAVIKNRCTMCHSSKLAGAARQAAPSGVNFDTQAGILDNGSAGFQSIKLGTMPRGLGALTAAEIEDVREFLACGAVSTSTSG